MGFKFNPGWALWAFILGPTAALSSIVKLELGPELLVSKLPIVCNHHFSLNYEVIDE